MAVAFRRPRTRHMARCSFFRCRSTNRPRRRAVAWYNDRLAGRARARIDPQGVSIMVEERAVVFVIDDDPSMRLALEDLVRSVGLEVRVFAAPQEFLKPPDAPGCLVLDVRLPGMSGLTFQQELAKEGLALPVIFITGHGDIPMSVRAMKAGAVEFLTKPFHDQDLLDAIHTAIERDRKRRRDAVRLAELRERFATLSERERQIMTLV